MRTPHKMQNSFAKWNTISLNHVFYRVDLIL